jgi:tetratricopeptide (TPR) repeat protein
VAGLAAAVAVLLAATAVVSTSAAVWILSLRNEEAAARADAEHHAKVAASAERLARGEAVRAKAAETQAKSEAQRADAQAQVAMQVSDFLAGMFQGADPVGLTGNTRSASSGIDIKSTTLDILKQGAARVQQDTDALEKRLSSVDGAIPEPLAGELAIQAKLLNAIGNVYTSYMRFDDAEPLLLKSLALRRRLFGADHADVAETLHNLSVFRFAEGDFEAAEEAARDAVKIRREKLDSEDLRTAASEFMLAWIINFGRGQRHAEAQELMERVVATRRAALGDEDREVALARLGLAMVLFKTEDNVRAANEVRMAAEVMLRSGVDRRLTEAIELVVQALLSRTLGNVAGSVELNERAVAKLAEVLGPQHPAVTYLKREVALALDRNGLTQRAEQLFRESLEIDRRNLGQRPFVGRSIGEYAAFLHWHHRFDEAAEQFAAALEILQKRMSRDSADVGEARQRIGSNELLRGNYAQARRELEESVRVGALWQSKYGPADLRWSLALLGRAAAVSGDREAYGQTCRQLIDTVHDSADRQLKRGAAYHCIWLPQSLPDLSRPVALAKEAIGVEGAFPSSGRAIYAATLYRAGQYKDALTEFNTCIAEQPAGLDFLALVFLAMTHERLGDNQEAQRRLSECEQWMTARLERKANEAAAAAKAKSAIAKGETPPKVYRPPPLIEWDETVLYKLILDEAKGLIGRQESE